MGTPHQTLAQLLKDAVGKTKELDWDYKVLPLIDTESAKVKDTVSGRLPLHVALWLKAPIKIVRRLLEVNREGATEKDERGRLPLHAAVANEATLEVVALLLKEHRDGARMKDSKGYLPLHIAAWNKAPLEVVSLLLQAHSEGAREMDNYGARPLHYAAEGKAPLEVVRLLLKEHSKGVMEFDHSGRLPIHLAAGSPASKEVMEVLIEAYPESVKMKDSGNRYELNWWRLHLQRAKAQAEAKAQQQHEQQEPQRAMAQAEAEAESQQQHEQQERRKDTDETQSWLPIQYAIWKNASVEVLTLLALEDLPINRESLEAEPPVGHCFSWTTAVDGTKNNPEKSKAFVLAVFNHYDFSQAHCLALANSKDLLGRETINFASEEVQQLMYKYIYFCGRYQLQTGKPIHRSATAVVVAATDYGLAQDYSELFGEHATSESLSPEAFSRTVLPKLQQRFGSEANAEAVGRSMSMAPASRNSFKSAQVASGDAPSALWYEGEKSFVSGCELKFGKEKKVVIKFMKNKDQFERELRVRKNDKLDSQYIVAAIKTSTELTTFADERGKDSDYRKLLKDFGFGFVMPAADRTLDEINKKELPDMAHVKSMMLDVALALRHCHEQGVTHGDLKMLNVVRVDNKIKLIDFDASSYLPKEHEDVNFLGAKFSSGNLPPEMFYELGSDKDKNKQLEEKEMFEAYFQKLRASDRQSDAELWDKIKPISSEGRLFVVKTFLPSLDGVDKLPYSLIPTSPAADIWAFGVMLFHICTRGPLLLMKDNGDLDANAVQQAATWTQAAIDAKIEQASFISNQDEENAKILLKMILRVDPTERLRLKWDMIRAHPFFTGVSTSTTLPNVSVDSFAMLKKMMEEFKEEQHKQTAILKEIKAITIELKQMSLATQNQIKKTEAVLLRGMIEAADVTVPSCFILVSHKLDPAAFAKTAPTRPNGLNWDQITDEIADEDEDKDDKDDDDDPNAESQQTAADNKKKKAASRWMGHLGRIGKSCSSAVSKAAEVSLEIFAEKMQTEMYLYLISEYTHKPVIPPGSHLEGSKSTYPLTIKVPKDILRRFMPLMKLTLKAMVVFNGVAGLAQCLGYPVPKIPAGVCKSIKNAVGKLDAKSSVEEFDVLQRAVESEKDGKASEKAQNAKAVRGKQLRDLQVFFAEEKNDPKGEFAGLKRVLMPDGGCIWATEEDVEDIKAKANATEVWSVSSCPSPNQNIEPKRPQTKVKSSAPASTTAVAVAAQPPQQQRSEADELKSAQAVALEAARRAASETIEGVGRQLSAEVASLDQRFQGLHQVMEQMRAQHAEDLAQLQYRLEAASFSSQPSSPYSNPGSPAPSRSVSPPFRRAAQVSPPPVHRVPPPCTLCCAESSQHHPSHQWDPDKQEWQWHYVIRATPSAAKPRAWKM